MMNHRVTIKSIYSRLSEALNNELYNDSAHMKKLLEDEKIENGMDVRKMFTSEYMLNLLKKL